MADIRHIIVKYDVDYSELEIAKQVLIDLARQSGKTEEEIEQIAAAFDKDAKAAKKANDQYKKNKQEIAALKKEADALEKALDKVNDPKEQAQLQKALDKTRLKLRGLTKEAGATEKSFGGIGKGIKGLNLGSVLEVAGGSLLAGGVAGVVTGAFQAITGGIRESIDAASDFEAATQSLSAITGLDTASQQFADLKDELLDFRVSIGDFGPDIRANASEAAAGLESLGSQIPSLLALPEVLLEGQKAAVLLSATDIRLDTGTATAALSAIANSFGLVDDADPSATVDNFNNIVQQLATASKEGAANVANIIPAINQAGGAAAAAKVPLNETLATIEVLATNEALKGAAGGTALRNFFTILSTGADDTNPKIVGLSKALENLGPVLENEKEAVKIFGRENLSAARLLVQNRAEVERLSGVLGQGGLTTAFEQAAKNQDTYTARQERFRNQINSLSIRLGNFFLPILSDVIDFFSRFLDNIDKVRDGLSPLFNAFGAVGNAISRLGEALGITKVEFDGAAGTASFFGKALEAMTFGLTLAVNGLEHLINFLTSFITFSKAVVGGFRGIGNAISDFIDDIKGIESIGDIFEIFNPVNIAKRITTGFSDGFDQVRTEEGAKQLAKRTFRDISDAIEAEAAAGGISAQAASDLNARIYAQLDAGALTEQQAETLLNDLFEATQKAKPPVIDVKPDLNVVGPGADKDGVKIPVKVDDQTKKGLEAVKARVDDLKFEVELQLAGGKDSIKGIELLEKQAVDQLKGSDAYQELRKENEKLANEAILQERLKFVDDLAKVATAGNVETLETQRIKSIMETEEFRTSSAERQVEIITQVEEAFSARRIQIIDDENEKVKQSLKTREDVFIESVGKIGQSLENAQLDFVNRQLEVQALEKLGGDARVAEATRLVDTILNVEKQGYARQLLEQRRFGELQALLSGDIAEAQTNAAIQALQDQIREVEAFYNENFARIQALRELQEAGSLSASQQAELAGRERLATQLGGEIVDLKESLKAEIDSQNEQILESENKLADDIRSVFSQLGDDNVAAFADSVAQIIELTEQARAGAEVDAADFATAGLSALGSAVDATYDLVRKRREAEIEAAAGDEVRQNQLRRKLFESEKRANIAKAVISGSIAILKAFELGPILGPILAAAIAVKTGIEIANIKKQQFPAFKEGVIALKGPGTETSDSIPARLSRGESVIKARQTRKHKRVLRAINDDTIAPELTNKLLSLSESTRDSDQSLLDMLVNGPQINGIGTNVSREGKIASINLRPVKPSSKTVSAMRSRSEMFGASFDYDRMADSMIGKMKGWAWDDNNPIKQLLREMQYSKYKK